MSIQNPVSHLLDRSVMGMRQFEREFGFAHQTMIDVTTGTFERIPLRVSLAVRGMCEQRGLDIEGELLVLFGVASLEDAYQVWRIAERRAVADRFNVAPSPYFDKKHSPALRYVEETAGNRSAFSKQMKVPPATVMRWTSGKTRSMPKSIEEALLDIKYPFMGLLVGLQASWVDENKS